MPSKNPAQRLRDILDNIVAIEQFTAGISFGAFTSDRKTVYAASEMISSARVTSRRLPDDLKGRHPGIDWSSVAAAGNVYRHEYEVVDDALIWHTVQRELSPLREAVEAELRS